MKIKNILLIISLLWVSSLSAQTLVSTSKSITRDTVLTNLRRNNLVSKTVIASGQAVFYGKSGYVRILLSDDYGYDLLVYESSPLLAMNGIDNFNSEAIESIDIPSRLALTKIRVEVKNAELRNLSVDVSAINPSRTLKQAQVDRIDVINNNLRAQNALWVAGETSISQMSFEEKKGLFGGTVPDLQGFEYYTGGVFELHSDNDVSTQNSTRNSQYVSSFDWRNRHGANNPSSPYYNGANGWITSVKSQGSCGSCEIFAAIGATEAVINLYYNRFLNKDLSEQELVSCCDPGHLCKNDPNGGWAPTDIINYMITMGVSEESCFEYNASVLPCLNKCFDPKENIKISGNISTGINTLPKTEDTLKHHLIKDGPLKSGINRWRHAMTLVGYGTIKAGDILLEGIAGGMNNNGNNTIVIGNNDPRIGQTYWIFKNSYGTAWGQNQGYCSVIVYDSVQMRAAYAIKTPITITHLNPPRPDVAIACEDRDGDGYYFWGIGPKPATCPACARDEADGDDSNPNLGAMDEYGNFLPMVHPPVNANQTTTAITESWGTRSITNNIVIPSGVTLTITGTVTATNCNTITIQNGGKLILNGGTIDGAYIIAKSGSTFTIQNNGKVFLVGSNQLDMQLGAVFNLDYGEVLYR